MQEADWGFKTSFSVGEEQRKHSVAELVFEGLDTYCDVYLVRLVIDDKLVLTSHQNGKHMAFTDNMYTSYRFDVKKLLKAENELLLHFKSPQSESMKEMENHPSGPRALCEQAIERSHVEDQSMENPTGYTRENRGIIGVSYGLIHC